jgi:serine/threonine-protein kinase
MNKRAPRRQIAPGRRLYGRYRIERRIGSGGSADVWLAHDDRLDRTVAIKTPLPEALPDDAARDRFVAEARAAAGLSHPAIVPIYDVVHDPAAPAMVLRYVEGETLAERIGRDGPMPPGEAAGIAAELAGALAHAHAAGLVHRDVKPGNVLVDEAGRAQLVDFGIAGSLAEAPAAEPASEVTGTLRYMAPEQIRGAAVDGRSDLYALGLVLYELLAGRPAFDAATPRALAAAQVAGPFPLPDRVPADLRRFVGELLAVDPADRPGDALVVEARLRSLADAASMEPTAPAADTAAPPTIAPGLPAASAGFALLADAPARPGDAATPTGSAPSRRAGAPADGSGADTRSQTAALPIAVTAAIAPVAPRSAPLEPQHPHSAPFPRRRRTAGRGWAGLAAAGAAALAVAAIVLAAGFGSLASHPAAADSSRPPSPPGGFTTSPTVKAAAPAPPKHRHGHGHGNGEGDG